jgi:peptidoglycan/LPS O-acetylase OafA/YrhL
VPEDGHEARPLPDSTGMNDDQATRDTPAYVASIDSLRALAVVSVIVYHLHGSWLPGGFAGVDIFFVISGYVISRSMTGLPREGFLSFAGAFYGRRIRRILPALIVCLLTTSLLCALFIPDAWLSDSNQRTAWFAYFGLSNFALLDLGDAYFAPRIEFNPYVHTWSLGVEEQFYLLFPAIFFFWFRYADRPSRWRVASNSLLVALLLASLGYCAYATRQTPLLAYYGLPSRFWELAAGAALFKLHHSGYRLGGRGSGGDKSQVVLSAALMIACLCFAKETEFPFPWALAAVAGCLGVLDLATKDSGEAARINSWLQWPPAVWIGQISYSLYLWHWPIFVLWRWTIGLEAWAAQVTAVAATFALAAASYFWVENPFRRGPALRGLAPRLIVVGGICCACISWSADRLMFREHRRLSLSVTRDVGMWYPSSVGHLDDEADDKCVSPASHAPSSGDCDIIGPARRLFVTGNSHALAYQTMLFMLEQRGPFGVIDYRLSGCTVLPLDTPMTESSAECRSFDRSTLAKIESQLHPGDIVFLPSLRLPRLADQWATLSEADALEKLNGEKALQERQRALAEADIVLDDLVHRGALVILEAPKPVFRAPPFRCSDWFNRDNPVCKPGLTMPRDYLLRYRKPVLDEMIALNQRHANVLVWDPFDTLCPTATCKAVVNGQPLFFDADHLSANGARVLYPDFVAFLKAHLPYLPEAR